MSCERARSGEGGHESLAVGGHCERVREQEVYIVMAIIRVCVFVCCDDEPFYLVSDLRTVCFER